MDLKEILKTSIFFHNANYTGNRLPMIPQQIKQVEFEEAMPYFGNLSKI